MKRILILSLIASISFPLKSFAEEVSLPEVKKPLILNEGIQTTLTAEQIAELMPWAKDTKFFLVDLLDNIGPLSTDDKIEKLISGIQDAVGESAPKNSELLMRYILNRALVIKDLITKEADPEAVGTKDVLIRTLVSSVKMAIQYYDIDMSALTTQKSNSSFVSFGMEYFNFLTELNKSIFDASAQYLIERTALEWYQWDLYRDLNNKMYAPQIVKINNSLKTFSTKKISDAQAISSIRQMKKIAEQLDVTGTINRMKSEQRKIEDEKRLKNLKKEDEIKAEVKRQEEARAAEERKAALDLLRNPRTEILQERVNVFIKTLASNESWSLRRDAANALALIPGADITDFLLRTYAINSDSDSDVRAAVGNAIYMRLGNRDYTLKTDDFDSLNKKIISEIVSNHLFSMDNWEARRIIVQSLGKIPTVESYRILGIALQREGDTDVKAAIVESMNKIAATLK
jgi:hypothetical protein